MRIKNLSINNLGQNGLNTDVAPWDLGPEFITDGNNFKIDVNSIRSSGGSEIWSSPPVDFEAAFLMSVPALSNHFWLVAGKTAVYVFSGSTWSDISSAVGYGAIALDGQFDWTGCLLGSIPLINNPVVGPEYWSPQSVGSPLVPLLFDGVNTFLAVNKSFRVLRSHKNFLFALDLVENGVELPSSYRWSHPADTNGIPFTWDETDLSAIASIEQIGGDSGRILDGGTLRDAFCMYSERSINILDRSNDQFIFRRRNLSSTTGLLNKNCIAEVKGIHLFLGDGDILQNDGNKIDSIVHNRIRNRMNSNVNADAITKSFVVRNTASKEVWFCVPENGATFPNVAYVFNWKDNSWSIRDLPENISLAAYGLQVVGTVTWDTIPGTWDTTQQTWGSNARSPLSYTLVGVDQDTSDLVSIDPQDSGLAGNVTAYIERTNFALEGHIENTTIVRLYPYMTGTEPVNIQVGSHQFAGGPVTWKPPITFDPTTDRKIDVRTTGKLHAWRISSIGTGHWSVSGMGIEYSLAGKR